MEGFTDKDMKLIKAFKIKKKRNKSLDFILNKEIEEKSSTGSVFADFVVDKAAYKRKLRREMRENGIELRQ